VPEFPDIDAARSPASRRVMTLRRERAHQSIRLVWPRGIDFALKTAALRGLLRRSSSSMPSSMPPEIGLGVLPAQVEQLRASLKTLRAEAADASTLTEAELRLLPYLATDLSFREIGD
jgi:hypothetical protein